MTGYRDVAAALREFIRAGRYAEGSTLPTQDYLAESYGVNIHTVRRAVELLAREGYVQPVRRRGTVVLGLGTLDAAVAELRNASSDDRIDERTRAAMRTVVEHLDRVREPGRGTAS